MVEAEATRKDDAATVAKFLFKSIITRYGCPLELVSDRETHFLNKILLKVTVNHTHDWDSKLSAALWAYRTAEKITTKQTPYFLVYGQHPILSIEFEVPTQRTLDTRRMGAEESQLYRLQEVIVLEEHRHKAEARTRQIQLRRKEKYDRIVKPVLLEKGDLALLYDSRHVEDWEQVLGRCAGERGDLLFDCESVQVSKEDELSFGALFKNSEHSKNGYKTRDYKDRLRRNVVVALLQLLQPHRTIYMTSWQVDFAELALT
ncbi:hypothetical protein AXG93_725s1500 [Marchantia polymorpha subsp. ruderalis]|uniref:Integrase catalytic domain-containing protein n=1 Tax=Marchantia polymorpha subsp. ruderalis TaxID=1480154 RepID=A0A176WE34_MARPO|nr:hypothetical protein AXG93_725s1500 [Marchantia polymorpha subsp. ruderalis]